MLLYSGGTLRGVEILTGGILHLSLATLPGTRGPPLHRVAPKAGLDLLQKFLVERLVEGDDH